MLGMGEEDDPLPRDLDQVDDEQTSVRISEWLVGVDAPTATPDAPGPSPHVEVTVENLHVDDEVILPDKHGYRQVVFDSAPYKALLSRLAREISLTPLVEGDAMDVIRSQILKTLPERRHVSRYVESETFTMVFNATWDLAEFLITQYETSYQPENVLGKVITLTGSISDAQALPCSEYLSQTWPATGHHVLEVISRSFQIDKQVTSKRSIQHPEQGVSGKSTCTGLASKTNMPLELLPDRSQIAAIFTRPSEFHLQAKGTADFLAEIGEIVAWLTAALRVSPDKDIIAHCTPEVLTAKKLVGALEIFSCDLHFNIDSDYSSASLAGHCWKGLFLNPVVVRGFPILRRSRPGTGLEIPLDMAAGLVEAKRIHDFMGRFCLKGFSAMLAPVEVVGETVLWHLFYNPTGGRIPYLHLEEQPFSGNASINTLRCSRHVIGWCSDAMYMFGEHLLSSVCSVSHFSEESVFYSPLPFIRSIHVFNKPLTLQ